MGEAGVPVPEQAWSGAAALQGLERIQGEGLGVQGLEFDQIRQHRGTGPQKEVGGL